MGKLHIVQHLCPKRHCIMAAAYVEGDQTFDEIVGRIDAMEKEVKCLPWCGICGSADLQFEDSETPFDTLEEAADWLKTTQAANLAAMRAFSKGPKPN